MIKGEDDFITFKLKLQPTVAYLDHLKYKNGLKNEAPYGKVPVFHVDKHSNQNTVKIIIK